MIPGFDLVQFAQTAGPLAVIIVVAAIIFAENGLLIGFFFPGDSVLFTVGLLIQGTAHFKLDLNLELVILLLFVMAVLGANVGYLFGKKIGPALFKRPNSLLFKQENVQKAQNFYDRNGGKTIILARFIPVVRTFVPLIAGIAKMKYKTFMTFNIIGGLLWTAGVTSLGFFLGKLLRSMGLDVDAVILPIVALILIVSISPALYQLLKNKKQRRAIWSATKLEWRKVIQGKK
jgi:membrane-associated protein